MYSLKYDDSPGNLGEDDSHPLQVAGNIFLHVSLFGSQAYTAKNSESVLTFPNLREVVKSGDFEGQVDYVVGLDSLKPYRVLALADPTRLTVDIKH